MGRELAAFLVIALLTSCSNPIDEPLPSDEQQDTIVPPPIEGTVVLATDSDEWSVYVFKEHLIYSEAILEKLPDPWIIPTKTDAKVLYNLYFPSAERFITSDGYTFGMPSASVSKAGMKTKYSVLGLKRRQTTIIITY